MATQPLAALLRNLHDLSARDGPEPSDAQLLQSFREQRDQAAFSALVRRHGRMVLGVCRHVLRHEHDAEDAFQATFLVLARNADSIRKRTALASWLYGVAYRVASHARRTAEQRLARERRATKLEPVEPQLDLALKELQAVLAEEVKRLPEKQRAPFVLCCLEGKSKSEAAAQLGWKEGTVSGRLAEARKRMQQRLIRRGLTLSTALCAGALATTDALALPAILINTTARAGAQVAAGGVAVVAAPVAALVEGVTRAMRAKKVKLLTLLVLAFGLLAVGAGVHLHQALAGPESTVDEPKKPAPAPAARTDVPNEIYTYVGRVLGPNGKPLPGAKVFICGLNPGVIEFRERVVTGADGTFKFTIRRDEFGEKGVVPPGRSPPERYVHIGASADGCGSACVGAGQPEERNALTIWLPAEEIVQAHFVDLEGKPAAGVTVRAYIHYSRADKDYKPLPYDAPDKDSMYSGNVLPYDEQRNEAVTDKDGNCTLRGLSRGWLYELSISGPTIVQTKARLAVRPQKPSVVGATGEVPPNRPHPQLPLYGSTFTHVVTPGKPIRGMVREKGSGKPLANVEVFRPFTRDDDPQSYTKSDKDGRYDLTGLPPGVHTLRVQPPNGTPYVPTEVSVAADQPGIEPVVFDIQLERQPVATGRVIDRATGKPVAAMSVEYRPLAENPSLKTNALLNTPKMRNHPPSTATDKDGRFLIPVLRGRGVLLVADYEGDYLPARLAAADRVPGVADPKDPELIDCRPFPAWPVEFHAYRLIDVAEGKDAEVEIALTPAPARPLVLEYPDGQAHDTTVLGMRPSAHDHRNAYDPGKSFVLGLAADETRPLFVSTHDGKFAAFALVRGNETGPVRVKLKPTGTITGRVVDKDGKPIAGVWFQPAFDDGPGRMGVFVHGSAILRASTEVEIQRRARTHGYYDPRGFHVSRSERTDEQGCFRLEGLLAEVAFDLHARVVGAPDKKGQQLVAGEFKIARPTLKPGETLDLGELRAVEMTKQ